MPPQQPEQPLGRSAGLMYNITVEDVNQEYEKLANARLVFTTPPLEDQPWGDKGFSIQDPNGISLYIYSKHEPSEEFKRYFK
jgi:uncharacterized glyoxalase superfamily protein PhnB